MSEPKNRQLREFFTAWEGGPYAGLRGSLRGDPYDPDAVLQAMVTRS